MPKRLKSGFWQHLLKFALLGLVCWQWGSAGWIHAKALLAQYLIADAWAQTLSRPELPRKPWPWADTWPVARLQVPGRDVDLYVLAGAQGNSLAFGPGHMHGTALPGQGFSVIGGHRDTHFQFLQNLANGDELLLQTPDKTLLRYRVHQTEVVDSRLQPLHIPAELPGLLLVTCYPFDALTANGPLRYLVWAEEIADSAEVF